MRGTTTWSLHILAGIALVILLGVHMITMHLNTILGWFNFDTSAAATSWQNVIHRGDNLFTALFYIVFLGIALYHGLYGLRTIIFELNIPKSLEKTITVIFVAAGIGLFFFGAVAAYQFIHVAGQALGV